ncbi:MAG: SpoIIE family protein phosphatase [Leptospira sp.]|nr:SpoIIE family protein phosphatase [Leptospira sp.]
MSNFLSEIFFLNYYAIGYLINSIFSLSIAFFLFGMKRKSLSTKCLIILLINTSAFAFTYAISHSMYAEIIAYHRWITVAGSLLNAVFVSLVFLTFPENDQPKLTKYSIGTLILFSLAVTGYFIFSTSKYPVIFNFSAENFDFDADDLSAKAGGAILFNVVFFIFFGIYRSVKKRESRGAILLILLSYFFIMLVPAIFNVLTRSGAMERYLYVTALTNMAILGHFILIVTYLNNTNDPSSFMTKILAITLALFLVIMGGIAYSSMGDKEQMFDELRIREAFLHLKDMKSNNVEYIIRFDTDNPGEGDSIDSGTGGTREEFLNTRIIESIRKNSKNKDEIILNLNLLKPAGYVYFEGYKRFILHKLNEREKQEIELVSLLKDIKQTIIYKRNSIRKLAKEWRRYRENKERKHFVSYILPDPGNGKMVEIGFSYLSYRKFVHETGISIIIILSMVTAVILLGFRFFFYRSLVRPLEFLLAGVGKVNAGNLDVLVTPGVEDEIGFLTKSFNGMVSSISDAQEKLKDYANKLEEKVEERTRELQTTLEKVQELKTQQDGDYFLTSLLLRPLNMNKATSESIEVEFFSSQKKKFQFKEWKEEIGGDVCMANSIELKERKYTVFVNADAMGKSLQGAGGALVLGSVFESIINRNRIAGATREIFPERWIKDAFLELHHVFETFDGSMLVSLVLGLIDDKTGFLYMINAEHPWTILYRDGKASFINTEITYRKLGTLGADDSIRIFTAQLFPGDILISGSDGRDDIMMPGEEGEEFMNDDETLILSHVEKTGSDLLGIYSEIQSVGKLIDDITLVKISYKKDSDSDIQSLSFEDDEICEQAKTFIRSGRLLEAISFLESAIEHKRSSPVIYKSLFQAYLQANFYEKASKISAEVVHMVPGDTELLFQTSYILKKTGDYATACDLGERVKLRNPSHVRNLINLADSQFFNGNRERAKMLIDLVLELEKENPYALKRKIVFDKKSIAKNK